ncbi:MAG: DUF2079 domain-containing protein, partial [Nannocystaceae bacterium]
WALLVPEHGAVMANHLTTGQRGTALAWGAPSLVLALVHLWAHSRRTGAKGLRALDAAAQKLAAVWGIALLGPVVVWLADPHIARTRAWLSLSGIAAFGVGAIWLGYRHAGSRAATWVTRRVLTSAMCRFTAAGLTAVIAYALISLALARHTAMQTNTYDLGIFVSIVANSARGELLDCGFFASGTHMSEHFDPALVLLAPLHWLWPGARALIVFQALWLCAGAYPVYRLASRELGHEGYGLAFVVAYALYPAIHVNALWDFHSLSLGAPVWLWMWWAATSRGESRAPGRDYWAWFGLLLLVREEFAFVALILGITWLARGRRRLGLQTLALACLYAAFVRFVIAPGAGIEAHAARYKDLLFGVEGGLFEVGTAIVANPAFAVSYGLSMAKVMYFLSLVLPFCCLALAGGSALWPAAFGLVFVSLSSSIPVFHPYFHYTSLLYPMVVVAAILGHRRLADAKALQVLGFDRTRLRVGFACGVVAASMACSWCLGALHPKAPFLAGFRAIERHPDATMHARTAWVGEVAAQLPVEATVAASGFVGPQLAHLPGARRFFEQGEPPSEDYLLLWVGRFKPLLRRRVDKLLETGRYTVDVTGHGVWLLRRHDVASSGIEPPAEVTPST